MVGERSSMHSVEFILIVVFHIQAVLSLTCYWCSGVDNDRMCETRPSKVSSFPVAINCSTKFCVSTKVMDAETGNVRSFARSCDHIPRGNQCVKDFHFVTCYETCTFDLCNSGNLDPSHLPTRALSGVLLQPSEVFAAQETPPKLFNSKTFYKQLPERSDEWKYSSHINKTLNSGNYLSKFDPKRSKTRTEHGMDHDNPGESNINERNSLENSKISNYSAKKLSDVTGKGSNPNNDSIIQSYPFSKIAERHTDQMVVKGNEKVLFSTNLKLPSMEEIFWWEKPKDAKTEGNNAVNIAPMHNRNYIYESGKDATGNINNISIIRHVNPQAPSFLPMGNKQDLSKFNDKSGNYFPSILQNISSVITSTSIVENLRPSTHDGVRVNYANPVTGEMASNLVHWWEKAKQRPDNTDAGDLTVYSPWNLPQNDQPLARKSLGPARSGDAILHRTTSQLVKPLQPQKETGLSRGSSQNFDSISENAKSDGDKGTNWQQIFKESTNGAHNHREEGDPLGSSGAVSDFNEPEVNTGKETAVTLASEPFRASLGNLCRPTICSSAEIVNNTSFKFTANYGVSTGYTRLVDLQNSSTISPGGTKFTADSTADKKHGPVHTSPVSNKNSSLLEANISGQNLLTDSQYLYFTDKVVQDGTAERSDSILGDTVSPLLDGSTKSKAVNQSVLLDLTGINYVASAQNFPDVSAISDLSESQLAHGHSQISKNNTAASQQPVSNLEASLRLEFRAEQTTNDNDAKTSNISLEQQVSTEANQNIASVGAIENRSSFDNESTLNPRDSIRQVNSEKEYAKTAHVSVMEQTFPDRIQDRGPDGKTRNGKNVHKDSFFQPDAGSTSDNFHKLDNRTKYFSLKHQVSPGRSQDMGLSAQTDHQHSSDNKPSVHLSVDSNATHIHEEHTRSTNVSTNSTERTQEIQNITRKLKEGNGQKDRLQTGLFRSSNGKTQNMESSMKTEDQYSLENGGDESTYDKLALNKLSDKNHNDNKFSSNDNFNTEKLSYFVPNHEEANNNNKSSYFNDSFDKFKYSIMDNDKSTYNEPIFAKPASNKSSYLKSDYNEHSIDNLNNNAQNIENFTHDKFNQNKFHDDKSSNNKRDYTDFDASINQKDRLHSDSRSSEGLSLVVRDIHDVNVNDSSTWADQKNVDKQLTKNVSWVKMESKQDEADRSSSKNRNIWISNFTALDLRTSKTLTRIVADTDNKDIEMDTTSNEIDHRIDAHKTDSDEKINKIHASKIDTTITQIADFGSLRSMSTKLDIKTQKQTRISTVEVESTVNKQKVESTVNKQNVESTVNNQKVESTVNKQKVESTGNKQKVKSTVNKQTIIDKQFNEKISKENTQTNDDLPIVGVKDSYNKVVENQNEIGTLKSATRSQNSTIIFINQMSNLTGVIPESLNGGKQDSVAHPAFVVQNNIIGSINNKHFTKEQHLSEKQHPHDLYKQKSSRPHEDIEKSDVHAGQTRLNPQFKNNNNINKNVHGKKKPQTKKSNPSPKVSGNRLLESPSIYGNGTRTSTGSYYTTNNMAAKNESSRSQARMPRQRIYLRRNVHKLGRNEKLQSELKTLRPNKNSTCGRAEISSVIWLGYLLILSILF